MTKEKLELIQQQAKEAETLSQKLSEVQNAVNCFDKTTETAPYDLDFRLDWSNNSNCCVGACGIKKDSSFIQVIKAGLIAYRDELQKQFDNLKIDCGEVKK